MDLCRASSMIQQQQDSLMTYSIIWVSWHFSLAMFYAGSCVPRLCWQELQVHIMQSLIICIIYSLATDLTVFISSENSFSFSLLAMQPDPKSQEIPLISFFSAWLLVHRIPQKFKTCTTKSTIEAVCCLGIKIQCKWEMMTHSCFGEV